MKKILLLLAIFMYSLSIFAQVNVKASLDTATILIGEQTNIRLQVTQDKAARILFPLSTPTVVEGIEVLSQTPPDTIKLDDDLIQVSVALLVTSFDSALYYIPPFKFVEGVDTIYTNANSLKVLSLPVDTVKQEIFDIRDVYAPPINWWRVLGITLLVLLVLAAAVWVYFYFKRKKLEKTEAIEEKRKLNPHEYALQELDRIRNEKLWQHGRVKEFYTDLTEVLRQYIEHRYQIPAMEMTSDEVMEHIELLPQADREANRILSKVLRLADLVKFAKWIPENRENDSAIIDAYEFVGHTKEEEKIEEIQSEELSERETKL
ncbi:MAG: DUF4381 family protein [Prevotellaceae bacterium]|jgi:hypothetical protein|nr:DUF4381 family protein [Prevotellaceae bacterium]